MDRCDSRTVAWSAAKPGAAAGTPTTAPGLLFAPSGLPAAPGHSYETRSFIQWGVSPLHG